MKDKDANSALRGLGSVLSNTGGTAKYCVIRPTLLHHIHVKLTKGFLLSGLLCMIMNEEVNTVIPIDQYHYARLGPSSRGKTSYSRFGP